jgi:membrane-bound ClpP family serine protease
MTLFGIILMILAGLVLFLLELLVIPGISIAGIGALVLMAVSVYLAFSLFGTTTGTFVLLGVLLSMGFVLALTFRSKTWRRVSLHTQMKSKTNEVSVHGWGRLAWFRSASTGWKAIPKVLSSTSKARLW